MVTLETTEGVIVLQLEPDKAPKTVANFLRYVQEGFYDGTIFHRVIDNFMIQGGGFTTGMKQKSTGAPIENEGRNGLRNMRGTIAMARTNDPHSATAQFFINVTDNDFLNHSSPTAEGWGYCVFGRVTDGMEVVDRIKGAATKTWQGHQNVPVTEIVINRASTKS